jgi:hypothetical protein
MRVTLDERQRRRKRNVAPSVEAMEGRTLLSHGLAGAALRARPALVDFTERALKSVATASVRAGSQIKEALTLPTTVTLLFKSLVGRAPSITLNVQGQTVKTGPITFKLDKTNPANNTETFHVNTLTVHQHDDLILTAPVFKSLGFSSLKVQDVQDGTFTVALVGKPVNGTQNLAITAHLSETLIVPPGTVFAGWTWTLQNQERITGRVQVKNGQIQSNGNWTMKFNTSGSVTNLGGQQFSLRSSGNAVLRVGSVS